MKNEMKMLLVMLVVFFCAVGSVFLMPNKYEKMVFQTEERYLELWEKHVALERTGLFYGTRQMDEKTWKKREFIERRVRESLDEIRGFRDCDSHDCTMRVVDIERELHADITKELHKLVSHLIKISNSNFDSPDEKLVVLRSINIYLECEREVSIIRTDGLFSILDI